MRAEDVRGPSAVRPASAALAGAALIMLAWPASALPAAHSIYVSLCGGGFVRLDLPGPAPAPKPGCEKACHAWCGRKGRTIAADPRTPGGRS